MTLDPALLEILACPEDKGPLLYFADDEFLYNPRLKRRYEITDDIPIMLIDEATTVDDAEHRRLSEVAEQAGIRPTFDPSVPVEPSAAAEPPAPVEPSPPVEPSAPVEPPAPTGSSTT